LKKGYDILNIPLMYNHIILATKRKEKILKRIYYKIVNLGHQYSSKYGVDGVFLSPSKSRLFAP